MPLDSDSFSHQSAVLMQADMLFRLERYREAEEILRRWLVSSPSSSVEVQAVLSEAISRQPWRYVEALAEAHRAIAQDPSAAIGYYVLAIILADGDPKAALAALDGALRCAPDRPAFYSLRARIFLRMKQPKQALAAIEAARRLAPENVDAIFVCTALGMGELLISRNGMNSLGAFGLALAVSAVVIGWPGKR